ncbi:MAG: universal stress protein [Lysobacterales bacterium]
MPPIIIDIADPGSDQQPGIEAALACRPEGGQFVLFHNVYHHSIIDQSDSGDQVLEEMQQLLLQSRRGQLEKLAEQRFADAIDTHIVWAQRGWQELIRFAMGVSASMVVTQTNHRNRWQRLTLSNDDWETIRHCPVPLLLARADVTPRYQQVIAAVDPLHLDDKPASLDRAIVANAAQISRVFDAKLKVINVVTPSQMAPMGGPESTMVAVNVSDHVIAAHREATEHLADTEGAKNAEVLVTVGTPEEEIIEQANAMPGSLVVMGGVSRSRLQRLLIGNTAERVLDQLTGDVLVIKPQGFGEGLPAINALLTASLTSKGPLLI